MAPSLSQDQTIESFANDSQSKVEVQVAPVAEPMKTVEVPKVEVVAPVVANEEKKTEVAGSATTAEVKTPTSPLVVEEPKIETTPVLDMGKIFSEASGGKIKSAEELAKILKEHNEFKERIAQSPEFDDYAVKLNSWMKKGHDPKLFHQIHDLPLDEMSAEDKMKVSLSLDNPTWSKDDVDTYVKHTYGLMSEDEEGYNAQSVRIGKLKLEHDAKSHDAILRKLQEMTVYSNVDEQEAVKSEGVRKETWKQNLPKIVNDINTIPFTLDEKGTVFNYIPTPLQRQAVVNAVQNAVINAAVAYDEQGIKSVTSLIQKEFINQNINQIIRAVAVQQKSADIKQEIVHTHNPSGMTTPVAPAPVVEKSRDDILFDVMLASV